MEPGSSPTGGGAGRLPAPAAGRGNGLEVDVVLQDAGWRRLLPRAEALARRAVRAALRGTGASGTLTVLLADDRELRRLNGEHRGKDKPTNVLSFPGGSGAPGRPPGHLGDIALALGTVRREAEAAGKRPAAHFAHLVAHGALHLLGHDHLSAGEARRMERAEARAMRHLRLPNPWKPPLGAAA
ncbi:rRNA maturation RNase YbeY [Craurococcus roseus]|uniref:Endoribonuclease YbeY n=1 Tax=Craurococcus roseus TaxID=77585 RepID=A0ABN1F2K0_9PROT